MSRKGDQNGKVDAGYLLARKTLDIFPRIPKRMRKAQHHLPAVRLAQRVSAITPLFCVEKMSDEKLNDMTSTYLGKNGQRRDSEQCRKESTKTVTLILLGQ